MSSSIGILAYTKPLTTARLLSAFAHGEKSDTKQIALTSLRTKDDIRKNIMLFRGRKKPDGRNEATTPDSTERPDDRCRTDNVDDVVCSSSSCELTNFDIPVFIVGLETKDGAEFPRSLELLVGRRESNHLCAGCCGDLSQTYRQPCTSKGAAEDIPAKQQC